MPYDSNGNYSLPPGYKVGTGDTVLPTQHNPPLEDIAGALSSLLLWTGVAPMEGDLPLGDNRIVDLGAGILLTDAATIGQLSNSMPIGATLDFAGSTAPSGWLMCFGQEVSRTEYSSLFSVTGVAYGTGNGSTTFNLPDLRGRVIAGKDNMGGTAAERITTEGAGIDGKVLGAVGGAQAHTLTADEMPEHAHEGGELKAASHKHVISIPARDGFWSGSGNDRNRLSAGNPSGGSFSFTAAAAADSGELEVIGLTAKAGAGSPHPSMQPTVVMNKIIRALAA